MPYQLIQHGDAYYLTTPDLVLELGAVREHSDGLHAELTAVIPVSGARHWARVNIASPTSRASLVKALTRYGCVADRVADIVDEACYLLQRAERQGTPSQELTQTAPTGSAWFVPGLFPLGETSILYGDGASGKSLLALALAVAGRTGEPLGRTDRWRVSPLEAVLYLDWESQHRDHSERLYGLSRMHGAGEAVPRIYHRAMTRSLTDSIGAVRKEVADKHVDLVICDSLGAASGAEPESADAAVRTLNALRLLDATTRLVIAHISKMGAEMTRGQPKPYGSVYVSNLARSTVLAVASEQVAQDELVVTYYHTKINRGARQSPRALRFAFEDNNILVNHIEPDLSRASLPQQILDLLKRGTQTVASLSDELSASPATVRKTLDRLENRGKVIPLTVSSGGRGKETQWGRAVENRGTEEDKP